MKICKTCNENLVEDEYHLLTAFSMYTVIREKYEDLVDGDDNVSLILKMSTRKGEHMCVCYFQIGFLHRVVTSLLRK